MERSLPITRGNYLGKLVGLTLCVDCDLLSFAVGDQMIDDASHRQINWLKIRLQPTKWPANSVV